MTKETPERKNGKNQPLYRQISESIRQEIELGNFKLGEHLPAVSELVKHWQVDYRTINSALKLLKDQGLIRFENGRRKGPVVIKSTTCSYTIMFIRWGLNPLALEMTEGLRRFAAAKGLEYKIADVGYSYEHFVSAVRQAAKAVDGIIVLPHDCDDCRKAILDALNAGLKIVLVDRVLDRIDISSVSSDNVGGAYQAVKHLLSSHNYPVYYVGPTETPSSAKDRFKGWNLAMQEYHYEKIDSYICNYYQPTQEAIADPDMCVEYGYKTAVRLFINGKKDSYSIFTINDYIARGVYLAADEAGLKIGKNVYIASCGDTPLCEQLPVPLTSVNQANEQVIYEAANLLFMELIGAAQNPVNLILPARLKIRQSSVNSKVKELLKTGT